jgi:hypothetical protein
MFGNVLRAPSDVTARQDGLRLSQVGIWNAYGHLGLEAGSTSPHGGKKCKIAGETAVHLPVAGDELGAGHVAFLDSLSLVSRAL